VKGQLVGKVGKANRVTPEQTVLKDFGYISLLYLYIALFIADLLGRIECSNMTCLYIITVSFVHSLLKLIALTNSAFQDLYFNSVLNEPLWISYCDFCIVRQPVR